MFLSKRKLQLHCISRGLCHITMFLDLYFSLLNLVYLSWDYELLVQEFIFVQTSWLFVSPLNLWHSLCLLSVFSAVSGVQVKIKELHDSKPTKHIFHNLYFYPHFLKLYIIYADYVVIISCVILVVLFSIQHHGTHRVAFMFAPVVAAWLLCISGIGIYNIFHWNRQIYRALSPFYMLKFLKTTGLEGWMSLGGVVLSITGTYIYVYDIVFYTFFS